MGAQRVAIGEGSSAGLGGLLARVRTGVLLAALLATPAPAAAQDAADTLAFREVRLEAGVVRGLADDLLGAWGPARGGFLRLAFPWGGGEVGARVEVVRHPPRGSGPEALDELRALVGWARPVPLPGPFFLRLGGELGGVHFRLPRPDNPQETEVAAGVLAGAGWRITEAWRLELGVRRLWTFTEPVLRRDALTLALGRSVGLPPDLRRALGGALPGRNAAPAAGQRGVAAAPGAPASRLHPSVLSSPRWAPTLDDVSGWAAVSIDGVTVRVAPPGVPSAEVGRLVVRLDGWEVPLDLLGVTTLERLPVEPASVAAARIRPGFLVGRPGVDAVLDLRSRPLPAGFSSRVSVHGANATGDGGPRALVVGGGPNVESLAWGYGASLGWTSRGLAVRAEGSHHRRWVSELPVFRRNFEAVDPAVRWPWVDVRRGRVALAADVGALRHEVTLAGSSMDDFFLLPGLVREVPAAVGLGAAWLRGRGEVMGGWDVTYGIGHTVGSLEATQNRLGRTLDWRESVTSGRAALRRAGGGVALTLERRRTGAGVPLSDSIDGEARLEGDVALPLGTSDGALRLELTGAASRVDGRWGGAGSAGLVRRAGSAASGVRLAAEKAPAAARAGPWLQEARGLALLERWGIGRSGPTSGLPALRRWTAEAWHRRGFAWGWVELRGRLDATSGWWLPDADIVVADGLPSLAGPPGLVTDAEGRLGWLGLRYHWSGGPLEGWGGHTLRGVLAGDAELEEAHATLPLHRSVHHLRWRPLADVAVTGRLEVRSAARYQDFRDAPPPFSASLPGGARLDLSAEKALLGGRAAVELVVRDVLDREIATHPLSGTPGLTLEVLGSVRLGGQPASADPSSSASSASRRR